MSTHRTLAYEHRADSEYYQYSQYPSGRLGRRSHAHTRDALPTDESLRATGEIAAAHSRNMARDGSAHRSRLTLGLAGSGSACMSESGARALCPPPPSPNPSASHLPVCPRVSECQQHAPATPRAVRAHAEPPLPLKTGPRDEPAADDVWRTGQGAWAGHGWAHTMVGAGVAVVCGCQAEKKRKKKRVIE